MTPSQTTPSQTTSSTTTPSEEAKSPSPSSPPDGADDDRRVRAYRAGSRVARERMAREAPLDAEALAAVQESDIVVVGGCYDHVEQVLAALDLPHTRVAPEAVARLDLRPEQLLVVNCPGHVGPGGVERVRDFVESGGSLFTTDWALKHVIEPAFPRTIGHNGVTTRDDVVRIEVRSADNPFLRGVLDGADDPQWWLEGSSYPITVLDPDRVEVLITSHELGERYGEPAVAVLFEAGGGEVFHMISHYYLQRTELRTARHAASGAAYYAEKGVSMTPADYDLVDGLSLGDVESVHSSARLFANAVARSKRRGGAKGAPKSERTD